MPPVAAGCWRRLAKRPLAHLLQPQPGSRKTPHHAPDPLSRLPLAPPLLAPTYSLSRRRHGDDGAALPVSRHQAGPAAQPVRRLCGLPHRGHRGAQHHDEGGRDAGRAQGALCAGAELRGAGAGSWGGAAPGRSRGEGAMAPPCAAGADSQVPGRLRQRARAGTGSGSPLVRRAPLPCSHPPLHRRPSPSRTPTSHVPIWPTSVCTTFGEGEGRVL